ncbi:MAG: hypothetical protein K0Q95_2945 [Bacteroidota bacterium]|jgi:hypothetical protein|nr:hypothetical protein [Bacteroidota bacterium]
MEQTNMETAVPAKRPQFLNVLCILSFIGTGIGIIMGVYHLATAGASQEAIAALDSMGGEDMAAIPGMESMMDGAIAAAKYAYVLAALEIVCNLLCLFGVLQMWKLKKMGFYIYLVAQLIAIVAPLILVGGGLFGGLMLVMAIFPIAFIVMYGLNLKHMQ